MLKSVLLALSLASGGQFTDPDVPPLSLTAEVKPIALGRLVKLAISPVDRTKYTGLKAINYDWVVTELNPNTNIDPIGSDLDIDRLDESIARFGSGINPTKVKVTVIGIYSFDGKPIKRNRKEFVVQIGDGTGPPTPPGPTPPGPTPPPTPPGPTPPGPTPPPTPPTPPPPTPTPNPTTLKGTVTQIYKSNSGILTKEDAIKFAKTCDAIVAVAQNQSWGSFETLNTLYQNLQDTLGGTYNSWNTLFLTPLYKFLNTNPAKTPLQLQKQLTEISSALKEAAQ